MRDIDRHRIIAHLVGEATEEELRLLREWRDAEPENEAEYQRIAGFWNTAGRLHAEAQPDISPVFPEGIAELAVGPRKKDDPPRSTSSIQGSRHRAKWTWAGWGVAASLVVGIGLSPFLGLRTGNEDSRPTVLVTEPGEHATVTLEDGTVVRLAPASELVFAAANPRSVTLRGRAFFAVTTREGQSFLVRVPHGVLEARGTRFGIEAGADGLQLAVIEGEVVMGVRGERVSVAANHVANATERAVSEVRPVDDVYQFVDWLGPFLVFSATPMTEVANEFRQRFDFRIEIADQALQTRTVTGWFADQSPMEMLEGICRAVGAECTAQEGGVRMELASVGSSPVVRRGD